MTFAELPRVVYECPRSAVTRVSQTKWLKQQKFVNLQYWKLKA